jgi:hypothetical protein
MNTNEHTIQQIRESQFRAEQAAHLLKAQLMARIAGNRVCAMSCSCGTIDNGKSEDDNFIEYGESEVVDIVCGRSTDVELIGMWKGWTIALKEIGKNGRNFSVNISRVIPSTELYPMFRNAFEPLGMPVNHPFVNTYAVGPLPPFSDDFEEESKKGSEFSPSGRLVVVKEGIPIYVQPSSDLTKSVWLNAELRVDSQVKVFPNQGPLMVCNIDPFCIRYAQKPFDTFESSQRNGAGAEGVQKKLTYFVRIPRVLGHNSKIPGNAQESYCPIARLVAYDAASGAHIFELDQSVEVFSTSRPA